MIRPDDEDKPFVARWNSLVRALIVNPSIKHVARAVMDYADLYDGTSCRPSAQRIARETGYDEKTVRTAWATLRGLGMAQRVRRGSASSGKADEYELVIPELWENLPMLGPHSGRFRCVHCDKVFNPTAAVTTLKGDKVTFDIRPIVFCPKPRARKGRDEPWCFDEWEKERVETGQQAWMDMGQEKWKFVPQARQDEW